MKLIYIANIRVPTEKAHGLQIFHMLEAFGAHARADVQLWAARRVNTPELRSVTDPFAHYGVDRTFRLRLLPTLDLLWLVPGRADLLAKAVFTLQWVTFTLAALIALVGERADVIYTRDALIVLAASLVTPRRALAYEPHTVPEGRIGRALQRAAVRRAGAIIPVTRRLADDLLPLGADPARLYVAHDGIRAARFADLPTREMARAQLGWPDAVFIVGYVGRLHTMNMDKGVSTLLEAVLHAEGTALALVGGPAEGADALRRTWIERGGDPAHFFNAGQVAPAAVPLYLRAFDACAMVLPFTPHFAYYASPLKLFEYMAAGGAIVASDFPSFREVLKDGVSALLVPPSDVPVLAAAIRRLRDDPALRARIGTAAQAEAMAHYTWHARAAAILAHIERQRG